MKRTFLALLVVASSFHLVFGAETKSQGTQYSHSGTEVEGSGDVEMLQAGYIPGSNVHVEIASIDNRTESSAFDIFYGAGLSRGLVFPQTKMKLSQKLKLVQHTPVQLLCSKGPYLTIYVEDEGVASGTAPSGYTGPYYISMWLGRPQVSAEEKVNVRYAVKTGKIGKIGLRIGSKGECQVVAEKYVKIL